MEIKIVNLSKHPLPEYSTEQSAGMDLRANINGYTVLQPMERKLIPTGLFVEIPEGFHGEVRPRSGLAIRHGITILNTPGTVDSDYRGELKIILCNLSNENFIINDGERIAQLIVVPHQKVEWKAVEKLQETERGEGGFGHTGRS